MSSIRYRIDHVTRYVHTGRVTTSQHVAYLEPRTLPWQHVLSHALEVDPHAENSTRRVDFFGNAAHHFDITSPYDEMRAVGRSVVDVMSREAVDISSGAASVPWDEVSRRGRYRRDAPYDDAVQFRYASPYVGLDPELADFACESFPPGRSVLDGAVDLMHRIHEEFRFDPGATTITTPVTRVLAERHGVCQDFAHLQVGCLRSMGLPARYVSGYLLTDPPPGQPRLIGADASHAWLSVHCPALGWIDLDPTNDTIPDVRHVTLAWGRDYGDVSPLRGVVLGGQHQTLHVGVSVTPIDVLPID